MLTSTRKRIGTLASWQNSLVQGIRGCGDSVEHGVILSTLKDKVSRLLGKAYAVSYKGLTNIDDVVSQLLSATSWTSHSVLKVWGLLKKTYEENGYELDETKSGMSMHKATYLGLSTACGIDLPSGLKTAAKGGWITPFGSNSLTDLVEKLKGYARAEQANLVPPMNVHCFYTSCATLLTVKDIIPPVAKDSQNEDLDRMLSVLARPLNIELSLWEMTLLFVLILPESLGGLAWPDMLSTFFVNS